MKTPESAITAGLAYATEDRKAYGLNLLQNIRENASLASLRELSKFGVIDSNVERKEVEHYRSSCINAFRRKPAESRPVEMGPFRSGYPYTG